MDSCYADVTSPPSALVGFVGHSEIQRNLSQFLTQNFKPRFSAIGVAEAQHIQQLYFQPIYTKEPKTEFYGLIKTHFFKKFRHNFPSVVAVLFTRQDIEKQGLDQIKYYLIHVKQNSQQKGSRLICIYCYTNQQQDQFIEELPNIMKRDVGIEAKCFMNLKVAKDLESEPSPPQTNPDFQKVGRLLYEQANAFYQQKIEFQEKKIQEAANISNFNQQLVEKAKCQIKVAYFSEFRQDFVKALRSYQQCYSCLSEVQWLGTVQLQVNLGDNWDYQMYAQVLAVIEVAQYKIMTLMIYQQRLQEALEQLANHLKRYKHLPGPAPLSIQCYLQNWISRQYYTAADFLGGRVSESNLQQFLELQPFQLLVEASLSAVERRKLSDQIRKQYKEPKNKTERQKSMQIDPIKRQLSKENSVSGGGSARGQIEGSNFDGPYIGGRSILINDNYLRPYSNEQFSSAVAKSESIVNQSAIALQFLHESYQAFNRIQAPSRQFFLGRLMGEEFINDNKHAEAKTILLQVLKEYRTCGWLDLARDTLIQLVRNSIMTLDVKEQIVYLMELSVLQFRNNHEQALVNATQALSLIQEAGKQEFKYSIDFQDFLKESPTERLHLQDFGLVQVFSLSAGFQQLSVQQVSKKASSPVEFSNTQSTLAHTVSRSMSMQGVWEEDIDEKPPQIKFGIAIYNHLCVQISVAQVYVKLKQGKQEYWQAAQLLGQEEQGKKEGPSILEPNAWNRYISKLEPTTWGTFEADEVRILLSSTSDSQKDYVHDNQTAPQGNQQTFSDTSQKLEPQLQDKDLENNDSQRHQHRGVIVSWNLRSFAFTKKNVIDQPSPDRFARRCVECNGWGPFTKYFPLKQQIIPGLYMIELRYKFAQPQMEVMALSQAFVGERVPLCILIRSMFNDTKSDVLNIIVSVSGEYQKNDFLVEVDQRFQKEGLKNLTFAQSLGLKVMSIEDTQKIVKDDEQVVLRLQLSGLQSRQVIWLPLVARSTISKHFDIRCTCTSPNNNIVQTPNLSKHTQINFVELLIPEFHLNPWPGNFVLVDSDTTSILKNKKALEDYQGLPVSQIDYATIKILPFNTPFIVSLKLQMVEGKQASPSIVFRKVKFRMHHNIDTLVDFQDQDDEVTMLGGDVYQVQQAIKLNEGHKNQNNVICSDDVIAMGYITISCRRVEPFELRLISGALNQGSVDGASNTSNNLQVAPSLIQGSKSVGKSLGQQSIFNQGTDNNSVQESLQGDGWFQETLVSEEQKVFSEIWGIREEFDVVFNMPLVMCKWSQIIVSTSIPSNATYGQDLKYSMFLKNQGSDTQIVKVTVENAKGFFMSAPKSQQLVLQPFKKCVFSLVLVALEQGGMALPQINIVNQVDQSNLLQINNSILVAPDTSIHKRQLMQTT